VNDADVLIEANRPGVLKRLGADYDTMSQINPGIVYASTTGYGQTGPYSHLLLPFTVAGGLGVDPGLWDAGTDDTRAGARKRPSACAAYTL
jgi:hypothetical protein